VGLQVCILASGSSGNSIFISSDTTRILVDAGISAKALAGRLAEIEVEPTDIQAICVSHEHDDHVRGLRVMHRRHGMALYGNNGTIEAIRRDAKNRALPWQVFSTGSPFTIGDLTLHPFPVPHDAYEPVGFTIACGEDQIGIATDLGTPTALIRERLRPCRMVVLEANHDERMLMDAPRPWHLKQRIRGRQGHLSNDHAATMLAEIAGPQLSHVFLAHLSGDCNQEHLALRAAKASLERCGNHHVEVRVAFPDRVSEVWSC
jgi:phosphoribosyl 1,2-cyclic phosphodiesterase